MVLGLVHEKITSVQCGASHSLALSDRGVVYSWGKNSQGQCGVGTKYAAINQYTIYIDFLIFLRNSISYLFTFVCLFVCLFLSFLFSLKFQGIPMMSSSLQ